jgi:hypothetical protein
MYASTKWPTHNVERVGFHHTHTHMLGMTCLFRSFILTNGNFQTPIFDCKNEFLTLFQWILFRGSMWSVRKGSKWNWPGNSTSFWWRAESRQRRRISESNLAGSLLISTLVRPKHTDSIYFWLETMGVLLSTKLAAAMGPNILHIDLLFQWTKCQLFFLSSRLFGPLVFQCIFFRKGAVPVCIPSLLNSTFHETNKTRWRVSKHQSTK